MNNVGTKEDSAQGYVVEMTEDWVSCRHPDGSVESLAWADLQTVLIERNNDNPNGLPITWLLAGEKSRCVIPVGATNAQLLIRRFSELPGFNHLLMQTGMKAIANRWYLCWQNPRRR